MSQTVAIEALHRAAYQHGATILLVSKNLEAATNLLRYVKIALPLAEPQIRAVKDNETEIVLSNSSRIKSVSASRSTGRSFAASHVYLDEFAFMQWGLEIYQSVLPTISRGGTVTILSTPFGQNNAFFGLWTAHDGSWSRHTIRWDECPEFDQAWYALTRPKYTEQQWASEFACDFLGSGNPPFRKEFIDAAADGWLGLMPAIPGHDYVTAWDIGRRRDATVGVTLDVTDPVHQIVAFERMTNTPFPVIYSKIDQRARRYPGQTWIESNGIGDPVLESIETLAQPFVTSVRSKFNALQALIAAHEHGTIKHAVPELALELVSYEWDDKKIVQDCVMAAAIAEHQAGRYLPTEMFIF